MNILRQSGFGSIILIVTCKVVGTCPTKTPMLDSWRNTKKKDHASPFRPSRTVGTTHSWIPVRLSPVTGPVWTPKKSFQRAQSQMRRHVVPTILFHSSTTHIALSLRFDKGHKSYNRFPTHCMMHACMHLGHRLRPRCSCWLVPREGLLLLLLPPPPPWSCTYASSALLSASASSPTSGS